MDEEITEAVTDALSNIPGIGPARKAALYAAGITTRAALAQASIEQIISLTGMPRTQAEKALETLHAMDALSLSAPSPQIVPPLPDESMAEVPTPVLTTEELAGTPVLPDDDQDPATANRGMLDNAAFRVKTALSDATRVWGLVEITKPLTRLVMILDSITEQFTGAAFRPKAAKRLSARLINLSAWIEKSVLDRKPLTAKRRSRVRRRLKSERLAIEEAVKVAFQRQSARDLKAAKSGSSEPKRRQKRIKK